VAGYSEVAFPVAAFPVAAFLYLAAYHVHTYAAVDHAGFEMPAGLENYCRNRVADLGDGRFQKQTTTNPKLR
jgi:hypothetical protein